MRVERRAGWFGAVVLLCCRRVTADVCTGSALAEFNRCTGDCEGYTCHSAAFTGDANCDVVVQVGQLNGDSLLPAEGVWQMQCQQEQRCSLLRDQIGEDRWCCPHGSSISE
jgi:hypothetical protein